VYIRGIGLIRNGQNQWFLFNARGDVVALTDSTGNVIREYRYDAFGNELDPCDYDTNPWRFTGEYFDIETGNIYLRARFFNPRTGRFTQQDPLFRANNSHGLNVYTIRQTANLYVFVMNNPTRFADPSGKFAVPLLLKPAAPLAKAVAEAGLQVLADVAVALIVGEQASRRWQEGFSIHEPQPIVERMPINPPQPVVERMPINPPQPIREGITVHNPGMPVLDGTWVNTGDAGGYIFLANRTPAPSNLRSGDQVKTPGTHPGEFQRVQGVSGKYRHERTGWTFEKSRTSSGAQHHHGEQHWHASPPGAKSGNYHNVDLRGNIIGGR